MTYLPVVKSLVSSALAPALTASGSTAPVSSTASITTWKTKNDELMANITVNPVLRIRDVYPGSRIRMFPSPGSRILDPGSKRFRIPDPDPL
jgi:hypothetical protein